MTIRFGALKRLGTYSEDDPFIHWCHEHSFYAESLTVTLDPHCSVISSGALSRECSTNVGRILATAGVDFGSLIGAEGFLSMTCDGRTSIMRLSQSQYRAFSAMLRGITWRDAVRRLSLPLVEKLFAKGILRARIGSEDLTGVTVPLFTRCHHGTLKSSELFSDELSNACITYASRYEELNFAALAERIYRFNHAILPLSGFIDRIEGELAHYLSESSIEGFFQVTPPRNNPVWYFFGRSDETASRPPNTPNYKLYVSPIAMDLIPCVQRLAEILPQTSTVSWKVGRGVPGILRADKICLYFHEEYSAIRTAHKLTEGLRGIRGQGVPFTYRYDNTGVVSGGMDPPQEASSTTIGSVTSWRLWISRTIAQAILLSKRERIPSLSSQQFVLWTLFCMGIDPSVWRAIDPEYWRN